MNKFPFNRAFTFALTLACLAVLTQCSEDEILKDAQVEELEAALTTSDTLGTVDTTSTEAPLEPGPTYTIPADARTIDGEALGP